MLGKKHGAEALKKISDASSLLWGSLTEEEKSLLTRKQLVSKLSKRGTLSFPRAGVTWKGGWREIGGKKKYYRSRWEANYARYLEFLKVNGEINGWEHKPKTF